MCDTGNVAAASLGDWSSGEAERAAACPAADAADRLGDTGSTPAGSRRCLSSVFRVAQCAGTSYVPRSCGMFARAWLWSGGGDWSGSGDWGGDEDEDEDGEYDTVGAGRGAADADSNA